MKVFICGATGVLGRRVIPTLIRRGHQVVGLSRSSANVAWLTQHGAEARMGDLFDREQVCRLSADCEAFLHLATAIPANLISGARDWTTNDRIRREGAANMVEAALRAGARLYVQQSITFLYGNHNGGWVDVDTPFPPQPGGILQSAADMEGIVRAAAGRGLPAITLRFGSFYSHDSRQTMIMFDQIRRRRLPVVGTGDAYWNNINVDDAACAVVAAVDKFPGGRGQTFNVCDDEPAHMGEILDYIAERLGARRPRRIPRWLAVALTGRSASGALMSSCRCRNDRMKSAFSWTPAYPNYREGYAVEIAKWLGQV